MTEFIDTDVLIIGGGPAGCSCALYTSRSSLKTYILDKNKSVGALAITHKIANYPGVSNEISGSDLLDMMRDQATSYGTNYIRAQVFSLDLSGEHKLVYTPEGVFRSRTIVLATGAMGRTSTLPGEKEFLGRGVSYCATCDAAFYRNEDVLVYGSNQEAVDEALVLTKFAKTVHWVTSGKPSRSTNRVELLTDLPNVKQWERTKLLSIHGSDAGLNFAKVQSTKDKVTFTLDVTGAFLYSTGTLPITDFLHGLIPLRADGGVDVDDNMMTSVPGVWAIGDIRNTPFKQAVVACSDGCIAAMSIDKYLNSRTEFRVDWVHK